MQPEIGAGTPADVRASIIRYGVSGIWESSLTTIEARMRAHNIWLPDRNPPAANYRPYLRVGNLVFIAGQTAKWNGDIQFTGKVGESVSLAQAREAARLCGLNVLLNLKLACDGDFDRVVRCVQLRVYVQCAADFEQQALVADGVSDLMIEMFDEAGTHVRAAVGCNSLPMNSTVEVEAVFEVTPE